MEATKTNRRQFLRALSAGAAALALPRSLSLARRATGRPNILFIMADDHAANAISCYGSRLRNVAKTPNIDRIAAEGARLVNCFCTNSICVPSRATILTGQYSHVNGVYTLKDKIDPDKQNVAKLLQSAGYQTAIFGKWHLKTDPTGFDHWNILPGQGRYHDPILREKQPQQESEKQKGNDKKKKPGAKTYEGFSTDIITDLSLEWLRRRDEKKPFFLMTHFKNSHGPWHFAERHAEMYKDVEIPEPESLWEDLKHRSPGSKDYGFTIDGIQLERMQKEGYPTGQLDTTDMNQEQKIRATYQKYLKDYLRCVAAIDENVGRLLDFLRKQKLEDDTVVIYTSDQGLFLGEHGYIDKRWMFEESLRMPFLIRYPVQIRPQSVNDDIIINADFAPTFLDYAGLRVPSEMQSRSFRDNLRRRTPSDWRDSMYYRYWQHCSRPAHYGLRTKRYKLIFFYGLPLDMKGAEKKPTKVGWELYDLRRDPFELNNNYDHPAYRKVRTNLKAMRKDKKAELGDTDDKYPEMIELAQKHRGPDR